MAINLYQESNRIKEVVDSLEMSIHSYKVMMQHEETLEVMGQIVFGYEKDTDFFYYLTQSKKTATGKISECIKRLLLSQNVQSIQLINLGKFADAVYEMIKEYPTVKKVCGDPNDEAELSKMQDNREEFMNALTHFIARQLYIYKYYFKQIMNPEIEGMIEKFIELRDRTRTLHAVSWQTAKTYAGNGLSVSQVTQIISDLFKEESKELAKKAKENHLGYLQKQAELIKLSNGSQPITKRERHKPKRERTPKKQQSE